MITALNVQKMVLHLSRCVCATCGKAMVQSTLAFMRAALKNHHSKQYLQIWKLRNANGWHTMDSNLIQDNGTCFVGNLEPFDYLDAYDDNTKLRDDWKHIVSHLQRRKFMITIFNRKELLITYDMQKQNEICSLLKIYLVSDLLVLLISLTYIPFRRIAYSLLTVILSGQIVGWIQRLKKRV